MFWRILLITKIVTVVACLIYLNLEPTSLRGHEDPRWGPEPDSEEMRSTMINVPAVLIFDLQHRLINWRGLEILDGVGWEYGIPMAKLHLAGEYWRDVYDWKLNENRINEMPQFETNIHGLRVHFFHLNANDSEASPLLLLNGWPSSIVEYEALIPLLTSGERRFNVIVPSIPGFGFGSSPTVKGFDPVAYAQLLHVLMERLGYDRYFVHASDWGAVSGTVLVQMFPDNIIGYHTSFTGHATAALQWPSSWKGKMYKVKYASHYLLSLLSPETFLGKEAWKVDLAYLSKLLFARGGYFHIHGTKPYTLAAAHSDSPMGLLAWLLDAYAFWSEETIMTAEERKQVSIFPKAWPAYEDEQQTELTSRETLKLDDLLTTVMIYWLNNTPFSSYVFCKEAMNNPHLDEWLDSQVTVPVGVACFPEEFACVPRQFAEYRWPNMVQYSDMMTGGHFAAWEQPRLFADDIRSFAEAVLLRQRLEF